MAKLGVESGNTINFFFTAYTKQNRAKKRLEVGPSGGGTRFSRYPHLNRQEHAQTQQVTNEVTMVEGQLTRDVLGGKLDTLARQLETQPLVRTLGIRNAGAGADAL